MTRELDLTRSTPDSTFEPVTAEERERELDRILRANDESIQVSALYTEDIPPQSLIEWLEKYVPLLIKVKRNNKSEPRHDAKISSAEAIHAFEELKILGGTDSLKKEFFDKMDDGGSFFISRRRSKEVRASLDLVDDLEEVMFELVFDTLVANLPIEYLESDQFGLVFFDDVELANIKLELEKTQNAIDLSEDEKEIELLKGRLALLTILQKQGGEGAEKTPSSGTETGKTFRAIRKQKKTIKNKGSLLSKEAKDNLEITKFDLGFIQREWGGHIVGVEFGSGALVSAIISDKQNKITTEKGEIINLPINNINMIFGESTLRTDTGGLQGVNVTIKWKEDKAKDKFKRIETFTSTIDHLELNNIRYLTQGESYAIGKISIDNLEISNTALDLQEFEGFADRFLNKRGIGVLVTFFEEYVARVFSIVLDGVFVSLAPFIAEEPQEGEPKGIEEAVTLAKDIKEAQLGAFDFDLNTGSFNIENVFSTKRGLLFGKASATSVHDELEIPTEEERTDVRTPKEAKSAISATDVTFDDTSFVQLMGEEFGDYFQELKARQQDGSIQSLELTNIIDEENIADDIVVRVVGLQLKEAIEIKGFRMELDNADPKSTIEASQAFIAGGLTADLILKFEKGKEDPTSIEIDSLNMPRLRLKDFQLVDGKGVKTLALNEMVFHESSIDLLRVDGDLKKVGASAGSAAFSEGLLENIGATFSQLSTGALSFSQVESGDITLAADSINGEVIIKFGTLALEDNKAVVQSKTEDGTTVFIAKIEKSLLLKPLTLGSEEGISITATEAKLSEIDVEFSLEEEIISIKSLKNIRLDTQGLQVKSENETILSLPQDQTATLNDINIEELTFNFETKEVGDGTSIAIGENEKALRIPEMEAQVGELLLNLNNTRANKITIGKQDGVFELSTTVKIDDLELAEAFKIQAGDFTIESKSDKPAKLLAPKVRIDFSYDVNNKSTKTNIKRLSAEKLEAFGLKITKGEDILAEVEKEELSQIEDIMLQKLVISSADGVTTVDTDFTSLDTGTVNSGSVHTFIKDTINNNNILKAEAIEYRGLGEGEFSLKIIQPEVFGESEVLGVELKELFDFFSDNGVPLVKAKSFIIRTPNKEEDRTLVEKNNTENEAKTLYILEGVTVSVNIDRDTAFQGTVKGVVEVLETDKDFRIAEEELILENVFFSSGTESQAQEVDLSFLDDLDNSSNAKIQIADRALEIPIIDGRINLQTLRDDLIATIVGLAEDNVRFGPRAVELFRHLDTLEDFDFLAGIEVPEWQRMIMEEVGDANTPGEADELFIVALEDMLEQFVRVGVLDGIVVLTVPPTEDRTFISLVELEHVNGNLALLSKIVEHRLANPGAQENGGRTDLDFEAIAEQAFDEGIATGEGAAILEEQVPLLLTQWLDENISLDIFLSAPKPLIFKQEGLSTGFSSIQLTKSTKDQIDVAVKDFTIIKNK